jgi:uncharacterized protein YndB with AHSA1/START domain
VDHVTVSVIIDTPRRAVFEYLADIANRPEFSDHYLVNWHLTREESIGQGAGARYRQRRPGARYRWGDISYAEVEFPHRIVELGRLGKGNRVRMRAVWELTEGPGGTTKVVYTVETQPGYFTDAIADSLGGRGWYRRSGGKALSRLRRILEEGKGRGERITVAGG